MENVVVQRGANHNFLQVVIEHYEPLEEVLRRTDIGGGGGGGGGGLCVKIRERQARFFGQVMWRDGMENIITTGMISGEMIRRQHIDDQKMWL